MKAAIILFYLFIFLHLYWIIIALQCCVSSAVQQSESAICIHISRVFGISEFLEVSEFIL